MKVAYQLREPFFLSFFTDRLFRDLEKITEESFFFRDGRVESSLVAVFRALAERRVEETEARIADDPPGLQLADTFILKTEG